MTLRGLPLLLIGLILRTWRRQLQTRAPTNPRRTKLWLCFDVAVWSSCVALATWKTVPWQSYSAFMVCLGLWGLFRLASSVALYRVEEVSAASTDRDEVVAGWLFVARPAATGVFFTSWGILFLATLHAAAAIVGVVLLAVGLGSLIVGVTLLRGSRRKRASARQVA